MSFSEIFAVAVCSAVTLLLAIAIFHFLWLLFWHVWDAITDREPPERNYADELYQAMQKDEKYREYIQSITESKAEMYKEQGAEEPKSDIPATVSEGLLLSQKEVDE